MEITKNKFTFNGKIFGDFEDESDWQPIYVHGTTSCAISFMSSKNYHTLDEIKDAIKHIRDDSNSRKFSSDERNFGERTILCVISPGEEKLEKNLKLAGFRLVADDLKRRQGYAPGLLKMYLLTF